MLTKKKKKKKKKEKKVKMHNLGKKAIVKIKKIEIF